MRNRFPAYQVFYPAASLYAALMLPASVLAMTGRVNGLAPLADPTGHAHEMLLGFALAVVAGNQLGAAGRWSVLALFFAWALARAAFVLAPASPLAGALNAAFAALIALHVLPRLFGSVKKLRNRVLPFILGALCAAAAGWQLAPYAHGGTLPADFVVGTVVLFALLMLFMGGRVIAPVVAGQLHRQGERLEARVQPYSEGALIATGLAALFAI